MTDNDSVESRIPERGKIKGFGEEKGNPIRDTKP